jgi:hypothetical protein
MLGLSKVGVTTTITASKRRSQISADNEKGLRTKWLRRQQRGESETELQRIESCENNSDWKGGIVAITTVTRTIGK